MRLAAGPARFYWKICGLLIRAGGALLLALCPLGEHAAAEEVAAAAAGVAEEGVADQEPAWIPSLSIDFETFQYSTTTTITTLQNLPPQDGTDSNGSPQLVARIGGELMGPRFEGLPGQPRLFVQGSVGLNTFQGSKIATTGVLQGDTPGDIRQLERLRLGDFLTDAPRPGNGISDCLERNPPTCATANAADFAGQGSEVTGELQTPEWNAALGVAFDLPVGDSLLLQLKPSVSYNVERVDFTGRIRTVVEVPPPPNPTFFQQEVFDMYEGTGSGSTTDQSLGLGFELDLALWRETRPVRVSLYLDTRFLWLLTDPVTAFSDPSGTRTAFTPPPNSGSVNSCAASMECRNWPFPPVATPFDPVGAYQVVRDDFEFRGGAGVRFSWVGFGPR